MKILLLNQFFWPDGAATSQLLTDLARSLAANGHEVTAICSARGGYASESAAGDAPPVTIHRVKSLRFGRGRAGRLFSYLSFYFLAAFHALRMRRQNIVVTLTTPPLLSLLGTLLKTLRGSQHFTWEMDLYPDVAVDLDYFSPGSMVERITGVLADFSRKHSDGVIALGECMKDRLLRRHIPASRIFVADNWADSKAITPQVRAGNTDLLTVLYSGNLGLAHDFGTILGGIECLRDEPSIEFLFVGDGCRRNEIESFVQRTAVKSVKLLPYVQRESLCTSLAAGDIGLVTQNNKCCGSVVPSKVYGLLAAGRPILYIGPADATPARIIQRFGCGWHIQVGEITKLRDLLLHLASHREEVTLAGERARRCLLEHFDLPYGVGRITGILTGHTVPAMLPTPELLPTGSSQVA